jgi:DNA-binding transcriptional regulator YiaG
MRPSTRIRLPALMEWNADTIRQLRTSAQMTQAELAQWLGVTIKQVKHLENRRRNPSGPVERLLDILTRNLGRVPRELSAPVQVLSARQMNPAGIPRDQAPTQPASRLMRSSADDALIWDA